MATQVEDHVLKSIEAMFDSVKAVFDLTSRIDERIKIMTEKNKELESRLDKQDTLTRTSILEKDVSKQESILSELGKTVQSLVVQQQNLGIFKTTTEQRITQLVDYGFKIIIAVAAAYLIWRLGLK